MEEGDVKNSEKVLTYFKDGPLLACLLAWKNFHLITLDPTWLNR